MSHIIDGAKCLCLNHVVFLLVRRITLGGLLWGGPDTSVKTAGVSSHVCSGFADLDFRGFGKLCSTTEFVVSGILETAKVLGVSIF